MSISSTELQSLAASHDIITIGIRADEIRRALHGQAVTFVRVADVSSGVGEGIDLPPAAGEVRIVGPPASRAAAVDRVREVASRAGHVPVSGFSLAALEKLASAESMTLRALLESLQAAGLEAIADAPFDLLQNPRRAIEEVNIAGLSLARLTIHQAASADLLTQLEEVAAVQRRVGVVRAFAPLPRTVNAASPTTGYEDVKRVALARLVVDNVASIQVDWSLYGPKLAQVALTVGADDVDGVSAVEDVSEGRRRGTLAELRRNVEAAGFQPIERNGRFDRMG